MPAANQPPGDSVRRLWQDLANSDLLPAHWLEDALCHVAPLAIRIGRLTNAQQQTLVVGINGAQGTGKSTLAKALALMLENELHLKTTVISLDDFYLSHAARQRLGRTMHPLLATRGVPGTHDISLALDTLNKLRSSHDDVALPGFDKARDDCVAETDRRHTRAPRDVIILEGWCIGVQPQSDAELVKPVNLLERHEDADGRWRRYVNDRLADDYQDLFANIDYLVMLKAPSFDCVLEWRSLQEAKLAATLPDDCSSGRARNKHTDTRIMPHDAIKRFIQHYERLTRHSIATLPAQADVVLHLDSNHRICRSDVKSQ